MDMQERRKDQWHHSQAGFQGVGLAAAVTQTADQSPAVALTQTDFHSARGGDAEVQDHLSLGNPDATATASNKTHSETGG